MGSIERFDKQMRRLKEAEQRLRGALQTLALNDKKLEDLEEEIEEARRAAQNELDDIKALDERQRRGEKREMLDLILQSADRDADRQFAPVERNILFELVRNQAGKGRDDPSVAALRRELKLLEDDPANEGVTLSKQEMLDLLARHGTFEMIMGDVSSIGDLTRGASNA